MGLEHRYTGIDISFKNKLIDYDISATDLDNRINKRVGINIVIKKLVSTKSDLKLVAMEYTSVSHNEPVLANQLRPFINDEIRKINDVMNIYIGYFPADRGDPLYTVYNVNYDELRQPMLEIPISPNPAPPIQPQPQPGPMPATPGTWTGLGYSAVRFSFFAAGTALTFSGVGKIAEGGAKLMATYALNKTVLKPLAIGAVQLTAGHASNAVGNRIPNRQ